MSSPSWSTCAGRARGVATLSLLLLLLAATALASNRPESAAAQVGPPPGGGPSIYLGLGPSSLLPVSGGVPVYTVGETIWAESYYNYSVGYTLTPAQPGAGVASNATLQPGAVDPIYTFKPSDPEGVWNLSLAAAQGPLVIPVRFVNLADHRPVLDGQFSYSLTGGNLSIAAQANLGDSYDQEVCAEGSPSQAPVRIPLPTQMGADGSVTLTPGGTVGVTVLGLFNEPLSFWFQLYQSYALDANGTTNLLSYDLMAAQSQPIDISGSGHIPASFTWNAPIRAGRYDLRAFFENSTGIAVSHYSVIVMNQSSWVPLTAACSPQPLQASGIAYSANLTGGEASWPRTLYYMYRVSGVEAVTAYPLRANVSSVDFLASPWSEPLQDALVRVTSSTGVAQTAQQGGSLFVLASSYPAQLNYSVEVGGTEVQQGSSTFETDNSVRVVDVKLSQLKVEFSTAAQSPISLNVQGPSGLVVTRTIQGNEGTAYLFLPGGSYTLTASQAGQSQSTHADLIDGQAASTSINFGTLVVFEDVLVATAVVAGLANVVVFALRSRRARRRV